MKHVYAYPDGSALLKKGTGLGEGGWGFCITDDKKSKRTLHSDGGYSELTTHNRMELTAFLNCLIYIYHNYTEVKEVTVYCDSKYVIDSIYFGWLWTWESNNFIKNDGKPTSNSDLWKSIAVMLKNYQRRGIKVHPNWVKGHSGNYFNELSDRLAGLSRKERKHNILYRN